MIRALFARLTGEPTRGRAPFDAAVAEARQPHWFVAGAVPDTVEGRFAVLATVLALITVRLDRCGPAGEAAGVGLAERFIESMDAEIRQMGVGDPALGKQVRALVGALAGRVEQWRGVGDQDFEWAPAIARSLYRDRPAAAAAHSHSEAALRDLWRRLEAAGEQSLFDGRF